MTTYLSKIPMIRKLHQWLGIPAEVLGRIRLNRQHEQVWRLPAYRNMV
jgi:hypothetical protein